MDLNSKPVVNPSFVAENFDGEILIYNETGTTAFYLNDAANAVLQLCREDLTVGEIIAYLQEAYPEHESTIGDEVIRVLESLVSNEVIELADAAAD